MKMPADAARAQDRADRDLVAGLASGAFRPAVLDAPERGEGDRGDPGRYEEGQRARTPQGSALSGDERARGDRADELAERGPDREVPEIAVLLVGRGLPGHDRLRADHEAQVAEAHHPAPGGHGGQRGDDAAERAAAGDQEHADRQQGRAAAVVRTAAERYGDEQREQGVDPGDDADGRLVGAEREGPVGDGGPRHRHRPLREGEGDDEAQQPAPAGPGSRCACHYMMPKRTPAASTTSEVRIAHLTVKRVWSPNSTFAMPTRTYTAGTSGEDMCRA